MGLADMVSGGMDAVGGVLDSKFGGVATDIAGGFLNNALAMGRQKQAQSFEKSMYQNRYTMQVADLKRAGLNPMLAYMQSPGSAPSSGISSAQGVDPAEAYNSRKSTNAMTGKLNADTLVSKTQADKNVADTQLADVQAKNVSADTLVKMGMPELIAAQVLQAQSSASQSNALTLKLNAEIPLVSKQIEHLQSQVQKNKSDVNMNNALIESQKYLNQLHIAESMLTNSNISKVNLESDVLKPRAAAASTFTGKNAPIWENWGKLGSAAWKFMLPTIGAIQ